MSDIIPNSGSESIFIKGEILAEHSDLAQWIKSDPARVVELPGTFWVARTTPREVTLICARNALEQGFYYADEKGIYFGSTVLEVLRASGLKWEWDWNTLATMVYFGHTIRRGTYHPKIHRLWAGDIVHWKDGRTQVTTVPEPVADKIAHPSDVALEALLAFIKKHGGDNSVVPLSAGYDSRLILSAFLANGMRPTLFVKGVDKRATDVRIAHEIAAALGLTIRFADLPWHEYVENRERIVELTSGTKTPDNWHTYIGTKRSGFTRENILFTGTNGEYARTLWADRGMMLYAAEMLSRYSLPKFWDIKLKRTAPLPTVEQGLSKEFAECLSDAHETFRKWLLENYGPPHGLGEANDEFFRCERIPAFHANGYSLYTETCRVRTVFLDPHWYNAVRQMPRYMKLASKWHREAIGKLYPRLLDFPTNESGVPMRRGVPATYWLGLSGYGAGPTVSYGPEYLASDQFFEMLASAMPYVSDLFDAEPTLRFVKQVRNSTVGQRGISVIAALAFWMQTVSTSSRTQAKKTNS